MDEQKLETLIERVLARILSEAKDISRLPKAYVVLSDDWKKEKNIFSETLQKLKGSYYTIVVLPQVDVNSDGLYDEGACQIVARNEAGAPEEDSLTIFPVASRNLVVKSALCLQDDFQSKWVADCITLGQTIYMQKENPMFSGKEPYAYKRKIESYYKELEAFGVTFDSLPLQKGVKYKPMAAGSLEKKKIITVEDLKNLHATNVLYLRIGDVVTALAAERAKELGINILYQ